MLSGAEAAREEVSWRRRPYRTGTRAAVRKRTRGTKPPTEHAVLMQMRVRVLKHASDKTDLGGRCFRIKRLILNILKPLTRGSPPCTLYKCSLVGQK